MVSQEKESYLKLFLGYSVAVSLVTYILTRKVTLCLFFFVCQQRRTLATQTMEVASTSVTVPLMVLCATATWDSNWLPTPQQSVWMWTSVRSRGCAHRNASTRRAHTSVNVFLAMSWRSSTFAKQQVSRGIDVGCYDIVSRICKWFE